MNQEWDWPGSRWWRMDLHAHTPASGDFDRPGDERGNWPDWIEAAARANLDAIAITDHNTGALPPAGRRRSGPFAHHGSSW